MLSLYGIELKEVRLIKYIKNTKGELVNDRYFGNVLLKSIDALEDFNKQLCEEKNTAYRLALMDKLIGKVDFDRYPNKLIYAQSITPYYTDRCWMDIINYKNMEISCVKIMDGDDSYYTISEVIFESHSSVDHFDYLYHCYKNGKELNIIDCSQFNKTIVSSKLRDIINEETMKRIRNKYRLLNDYITYINDIHYNFDNIHLMDVDISKYTVSYFKNLCEKNHIPPYEYYQVPSSRQFNKSGDKHIVNYDIDVQAEYIRDIK